MVEVKVDALRMSLMSPGYQVVILKDIDSERYLPIFIGKPEGDALLLHLREQQAPRPLTHDLAIQIAQELGGKLSHVLISDLRNSHYFAQLVIDVRGREMTIDARPSDAIAIAVRVRCPIFIDGDVMEAAAITPAKDESNPDMGAFGDFLDSLDLDDFDKK